MGQTNANATANEANVELQRAVKALLEAKENQMETKAEWDALRAACAAVAIETSDEVVDSVELLETLKITKMERRFGAGGAWVKGTIGGHRFEALVFTERAQDPEHELEDSQISKIWLRRISDKATVANFDRGWDVRPTTPIAEQIVDLLAAGLAEHVFSE